MYSFIELLRTVAVLLITNSHFDGIYPWDISWGGCPGVSLFFTISGFLLVKSVRKDDFILWWLKKTVRLYIPMTIVNLITVLIGYRTASVSLFMFPVTTNLWYVPAITLLYVLYYYVLRKFIEGRYRATAILLTTVIYIFAYVFRYRNEFFIESLIGFRLLYGFNAIMIGSLIFDNKDSKKLKSKRLLWLILGVCSCGGFLLTKLLMNRIPIIMMLQFMTQVFSVAFAAFMLLAGLGYEQEIRRFMKSRMGKIFGIISACSLEVYLIQFAIISYFKQIIFPVNFILILAATVFAAWVLHAVSERILKFLLK